MINNKVTLRVVDFLLIILTLLAIVVNYFYHEIFGVTDFYIASNGFWDEYKFLFIYLSIFVTSVSLIFRLSSRFKLIKNNKVLIGGLVILATIILSAKKRNSDEYKYISDNGGVIKQGVVTGFATHSYNKHILVSYSWNSIEYTKEFLTNKEARFIFEIKDTVCVLFSIDNPNISLLYSPLSYGQLVNCKEEYYYLNGEIVDRLDIGENK